MAKKTLPIHSYFANDKGFRQLMDDEGNFVCNTIEYNGRIYSPFENFVDQMDEYQKAFPVYEDDIYLLTYPKSGTHWLWEILMMLTRGSAVLRTEGKEELMIELINNVKDLDSADKPRILNSHLCYDDMPPSILNNHKGKFIQIHRNPADVAVSFYHHAKKEVKGLNMQCNWDYYINKLFCDDQRMFHSTWFDYTTKWWPCNKQTNFLSVYYEDLKERPMESIKEIADFVNVSADEELIKQIAENTSFSKMKPAKDVSSLSTDDDPFFAEGYSMYRKGIIGDWANHFTETQHKQFMTYYNEKLKDLPDLHSKFAKYIESRVEVDK